MRLEKAANSKPSHVQDVLRIAARQSMTVAGVRPYFDGWVSFAGERGRSKAAARLHAKGRLERTKARRVLPFGVGWAYRIPR
jgi:hypothetical protein